MTELAFLIFAVVGLISTAKLWKPFLVAKAEELDIVIKDQKVDQQEDLHELSIRIDEVRKKHNGEWYTLDKLEQKMK